MYPNQLIFKVIRETALNMKIHPYITPVHADTQVHRYKIVHMFLENIVLKKKQVSLKKKKKTK